MTSMRVAALLPHVEVYGGVRRYLEIGNELTSRGHDFVLFHPHGNKPDWLEFKGRTKPFSSLRQEDFDVGLCSEYSILSYFEQLKARVKFFYFLLEGHKKEKEVARSNYFFLGNSKGICYRMERKYGIRCYRASGGVNPEYFYPIVKEGDREGFNVLSYGRIYKKRKGIQNVIGAVNGLRKKYPHLKLIFFDFLVGEDKRDPRLMIKTPLPQEFHLNLPQSRMAWLYSQADIFVNAEKRAGWANTVAEAMACQIPVVCTRSGTADFAFHEQTALVVPIPHPLFLRLQIKRLIENKELRLRLAKAGFEKIKEFSWPSLAENLEAFFLDKIRL